MASITALGTGSGLDLEGILTQLMDVERLSITNVQTRQESVESEISGLGQLSSALSSIQSAAQSVLPSGSATMKDTYANYKATVINGDVASASLKSGSTKPATGGYSLEVEQLATSHRVVTTAGANVNVADNSTLKIELGKLTEAADGSKTYSSSSTLNVDIKKDATLSDIRDAINNANGNVSATIITGKEGQQLVISSKETGTDNVLKISGIEDLKYDPEDTTGANKLSDKTEDGGAAAANAKFKINGIAAESSSNTVDNVLDGISLTLYDTNVGKPTTISVSVDQNTKLTESLEAFVTSYNASATIMSELGSYDSESGETGLLQGRAILRNSQSALTKALTKVNGASGSEYQRLAQIGLAFDKSGQLTLDSSMLKTALTEDFDGVMTLVQNAFTALDSSIDNMIDSTDGTVTASTASANKILTQLQEQESTLETRLSNIESRYRTQFTSLDTLVSSWNSVADYITQLTDSMNANSSAGK